MRSTASSDAKILLVEDQAANLLLLERVLTQGGYPRLRSVSDSRRAVSAFLEFQPDLVLLDLTMPYLDGVEVLEQLRPLAGETYLPVVVLTADVSPEARQRALAAGATDFLTKPFDAIEVLLRIRNLLETRSLHQRMQKRAEAEIRAARQRLEHVVASSPAVLFTLAVEGDRVRRLVWSSDNIREVLGYSPAETYAPRWWWDHIHPDDRAAVVTKITELFGQGRVTDEYRFRHQDGRSLWLRSDKRLLRDAAGNPAEVVGSWSDVTARKVLEDQFRQSQKMEAVGRLAGGIAHDFNNLLTAIIGYSEIALVGLSAGDPAHALIQEVRNAGLRAGSLTRQLLAFSRKQVLAPVVLDLNTLVRDTQSLLRRLIGADVTLTTRLDPSLGRVKADPGQLEQVLMNLVVNARDAMPTGGHLTVETRNVTAVAGAADQPPEAAPGVLLAVSDTGCGMTPDVKAQIFEPFFTTKGPDKGTGLGLATVYGIVKQSNGSIEVESEPGRGTTFNILLPRLPEGCEAAVRPDSGERVLPPGRGTVLLVEDEAAVRALSTLALRSAGYDVVTAGDGEEALAVSRQHPARIDLLVTDVVMPKMSGRQLADRLTATHPPLRVLFMSGYVDDTVLRHGVREAGVAFLQKPFTPASLARKVCEILGQ